MLAPTTNPDDEAKMFDLAPVSLWIEDYSSVRALFEQWRRVGVTDVKSFLATNPDRVRQCSQRIRVLKVNRKTLTLFGARDLEHLMANLDQVLRDDTFSSHIEELAQLWDGQTSFSSHTVNYTLTGERLDIQLHGTILPGHEQNWDRVMIAIEDVTEREHTRRRLIDSESYAFGLFAHSPVSLWVEDFSGVKRLIDDVRRRGVEDFRVFTDVHEEFVPRCMGEIRVLDVNSRTLELFGAPDKDTLLRNLSSVFRDEMKPHFREQLVDLWDGKLFQQREVVNYTLDGTKLHLLLQFSVLPGRERDWSLVQVALTDITARKKAEAYLEYLGTHDVQTRAFNRSFYVDELNRLERKGLQPVSIIVADINDLRAINDKLGQVAGDALLRRAGEVFESLVEKPASIARIGGDEFAVLLPGTDAAGGEAVLHTLAELIELNNQYYPDVELSISVGLATSQPGERLEQVAKRADQNMLQVKQLYQL
ncbi:PAS domain S-box-containing protein/diguanylate cyclase (GGDEF) domain-containing protein [Bradyrhizobium erythrophlei]|jgi:diguanylate cyclase (GGDEF)-like protein/PAS domain S-box-containing protein|uniref:PAS domain S-box-containing protein/diguanylate cyclase (GGDEF) domain-containing protein n=2 Tax=Bradyrhizobium erythrophlei TaxID=1437360 RepID=A0A1M7TMG7_9BRAD|nr:PAS domain S-box-containing protein/diguanylate cyclase (GGDEF) domain-containing protein [Bradyrhizobium erythrophlei]